MYLKGGVTRDKLKTEGGLRGAVDAKSADGLLHLIQKWCLGVRGRDFVGDEEVHAEYQESYTTVPDEGENKGTDGFTPTVPASGVSSEEVPGPACVSVHGSTIPVGVGLPFKICLLNTYFSRLHRLIRENREPGCLSTQR
jgi:hypothetical protein